MAILETARLTLRPFCEDDLEPLSALMANPDFMRFSLGVRTREETAALLSKIMGWEHAGRPSPFAVILRASGTLVGFCGFLHQEVDGVEEIEIAYRLHPDHWNKGIATEATQAVRDHAFRVLELAYVISLIHPDNVASRRVAQKMGMTMERETTFKGFPTQVYAIRREAWSARYAA